MRTIEIDTELQQELMDEWVQDTHYVEQGGWTEDELPEDGEQYPEDSDSEEE
jgi:hypothetical protein